MKTDNIRAFGIEFLVACSLLTRFPLPRLPSAAFENSARAVWAFPLAGLFPATLAAAFSVLALEAGFSAQIAAGLALAALSASTGAMHEDGLTDCADGFWGAQNTSRRMEIMKDSQIGTYGVLALLIVTLLRWFAYAALLSLSPSVFFAVAALSRGVIPPLMRWLPNARDQGLSQSVGRPEAMRVVAGLIVATCIAGLAIGFAALTTLLAAGLGASAVAWTATRKIAGQTGDVLGAAQQIAELSALLALLACWT